MKEIGLYIHIPFCEQKCKYCNFVSFCCNEELRQQYVDFLVKEISNCKITEHTVSSIYIGGGTPSLLSCEQITAILNAVKDKFNINNNAEITIECNPNSTVKEKLDCYKKLGINRISFGVQSTNNKCLKIIGRLHDSKQAKQAVKLAKQVGFDNINVDLLIGLPRQNYHQIYRSINAFKKYVTHFSVYSLILEEKTPLFDEVQNNLLKLPSENKSVKMYLMARKLLVKYGFERYEVSNFAKLGKQCLHNNRYWEMGDYLGFGVSAHSFYDGIRSSNTESLQEYFKQMRNNKILPNKERLTQVQKIEETIMLGLRQSKGINLLDFQKLFGYDLTRKKKKEIELLTTKKMISICEGRLFATDLGFLVLNKIILMLI